MGNKRLFVFGIFFLFGIFLIGVASGQCPSENLKTLTMYSDDADTGLVPSNGETLIEVSGSAWFGKDSVGGGAEWIWETVYNPEVDEPLTLTKTFNIPGTVERADFIFGIDNFLTLYVNGVKVLDHVPSMATPPEGICSDTSSGGLACCFCDNPHTVDIGPYLTAGENEIVFETIGHGIPGSSAIANPAGVIFRLDLDYCEPPLTCPSEMKAYWKLDENPQTHLGTVTDDSGNGNIGTFYTNEGATNKAVAGKLGSALSFDGVNDYVEVADSPSLNPADKITVEAWIKVDSYNNDLTCVEPGGISGIVCKYLIPGAPLLSAGYLLRLGTGCLDSNWQPIAPENNKINFAIHPDGVASNRVDVYSTTLIELKQWYHIVGTYDGSQVKLYVNGNLEDTSPASGNIILANNPLEIGRDFYLNSRAFDGIIDEVAIYDKALTADEIDTLYQNSLDGYNYCESPCPCSSGPCCDGCNYLPAGTDCGVCAACDGNGANEENCVYDETQDEDCIGNDIAEIATCFYDPDAIDVTYDYYAGFNSECLGIGSCTEAPTNWQDLITYTCDVTNCGAECGSDEDCICGLDDCVGNDYYDYPNYGICTASCLCGLGEGSGEPCEPEIIMNDPRCQEVCDNGIDDDEDTLVDCDDPGCLGRAGPGGIICCAEQETYTTRLCSEGVCSTNEGDGACCDNSNDCVFGGECYAYFEYGECGGVNNSCLDLGDESTDLEVCMVAGWVDPDNNRAACEEVNNIQRQTSWMIDGVCGMRELGEGNCNDANPGTANFCCGDDENEIVKGGFDDVCFVREEDCYLNGKYYVNDTYLGDNYCENGVMTSRTKLIALQLLDIADQTEESRDNYTLFCDSYQNTLNYYGYQVLGVPTTQYLNEINNFCVLKLPDQVIFGTSLNKPIDKGPLRFIDTLTGVYDCDDAMGENDGLFHQCDSGNSKAWYNNKTQSVIYSNKDILNNPPQFEMNFLEAFLTFLKNPFQKIFNFLFALFEEEAEWEPEDYEFINSTKKFSRLYLDRKDVKSIKGIAEEFREPIEREYISVTYNCYSANICRTVNMTYAKFEREGLLGRKDLVLCHYDPTISRYYVASNSSLAIDLWPELTARLRTEGVEIPDTSLIPHIKAPLITIMGYPITFNAEVEGCNPPFSYTWTDSFGEEISDVKNPTPTFTQLGPHTITLTVTDTDLDGSHESNTVTSVVDVISLEDCTVKTKQEGCGNDNCILSLSDGTDAHATKQCDSDFEYVLCCPNIYELDVPGCQEGIISLSNIVDAHADALDQGSFINPVCVKSTIIGTEASCRYIDSGDCDKDSGEICVVSLSDTEDAHLSQCEGTQFGVKVCCKIE